MLVRQIVRVYKVKQVPPMSTQYSQDVERKNVALGSFLKIRVSWILQYVLFNQSSEKNSKIPLINLVLLVARNNIIYNMYIYKLANL